MVRKKISDSEIEKGKKHIKDMEKKGKRHPIINDDTELFCGIGNRPKSKRYQIKSVIFILLILVVASIIGSKIIGLW